MLRNPKLTNLLINVFLVTMQNDLDCGISIGKDSYGKKLVSDFIVPMSLDYTREKFDRYCVFPHETNRVVDLPDYLFVNDLIKFHSFL